ncbi:hypothetical protein NIES267_42670 [Calothrix parasitica NIES-267]|uniref:Peptidase S74 domain-containing protein n=1 Tax=Calothrix parasitica NIES-267 TaxID=1973488 RepID=A0A1Z4LU40_9CYAN|nr:hypothetical protein NIES267_42670 [Calothrix parasitica NIES-267]
MAKTTDFTNFSIEHPNYFPGQYLLEEDFELQHKYLSDRQRYQNQSLYVSGIIEGLEVEVNQQDKKAIKIKPGSAIDSKGNLIVLKEDSNFSGFNNITSGELYIQYQEEKQNKQQDGVDESYTRRVENPLVGFAEKTPDYGVKLVKATISEDNITLDDIVREYSGISLPNSNSKALTLRSGGNTNPNLAVLTGSLKIDEDLTVNGTGTSSFAGNLTANEKITSKTLQIINTNQEPNGNTLIIGKTDQSNLRLGYHENYSWIQSHGTKPLAINAVGNNVGIGTNNPGNYKLNVQGSQYLKGSLTIEQGNINLDGEQQIVFANTDTTNNLKLQLWTGYGFGINSSTLFYTANGNHSWRDRQSAERMLLTTQANGGLTVKGTGTSFFAGSLNVSNGITSEKGIIVDGERAHINGDGAFYRHNGQAYITVDDNLYVRDFRRNRHIHLDVKNQKINYSSDARLKKNIQTIESGLQKILSLQGVTFQWKENEYSQQTDRQLGFIAQEVETIFPELVHIGSDGMRTMNYTGLIAPMIEAIKEQQKQISILSMRLEEQQNNDIKLRN